MEKILVKSGVYSFVLAFFFFMAVHRPVGNSYGGMLYEVARYSGITMIIVVTCVWLYLVTEKKNLNTEPKDKNKS